MATKQGKGLKLLPDKNKADDMKWSDELKDLELLPFEGKAEKRELAILKRRIPQKGDAPNDKTTIRKHVGAIKRYSYFYRNFETRFPIDRGDVFFVDFGSEGCGNELCFPHFCVALQSSVALNQMVTVVPLHSAKKFREPNPASEVEIGTIPGVLNGKTSIAMINQTRSVDKRRLFNHDVIANLSKYKGNDGSGSYCVVIPQFIYVYRLTKEQLEKITKAVITFFGKGYISH